MLTIKFFFTLIFFILSSHSFSQNLKTYQKECQKPYLGTNGSISYVSSYVFFEGCYMPGKTFKSHSGDYIQVNLLPNSEGVFCSAILDGLELTRANLLTLEALAQDCVQFVQSTCLSKLKGYSKGLESDFKFSAYCGSYWNHDKRVSIYKHGNTIDEILE